MVGIALMRREVLWALLFVLLFLPLSVEVPGWPIVATPADVVSVHVPADDGTNLRARLHVPTLLRGEPTAPAALLLHGVPNVEPCEDFAVGLRDAGIHCLVLHYRGCGGSEGVFCLSSIAGDVSVALDWLARCGSACLIHCAARERSSRRHRARHQMRDKWRGWGREGAEKQKGTDRKKAKDRNQESISGGGCSRRE